MKNGLIFFIKRNQKTNNITFSGVKKKNSEKMLVVEVLKK